MNANPSSGAMNPIGPPRLAVVAVSCAVTFVVLLIAPAFAGAQSRAVIEISGPSSFGAPMPMALTRAMPTIDVGNARAAMLGGSSDALVEAREPRLVTRPAVDGSRMEADRSLGEGDVVRKSGFRKRSTDLFRAQRNLHLGHQDVQLRLRLRAKSRNAISVELRF